MEIQNNSLSALSELAQQHEKIGLVAGLSLASFNLITHRTHSILGEQLDISPLIIGTFLLGTSSLGTAAAFKGMTYAGGVVGGALTSTYTVANIASKNVCKEIKQHFKNGAKEQESTEMNSDIQIGSSIVLEKKANILSAALRGLRKTFTEESSNRLISEKFDRGSVSTGRLACAAAIPIIMITLNDFLPSELEVPITDTALGAYEQEANFQPAP